jgi:hypothetical protein
VGKKNRSVGATLMNQDSSRSHSVFTITVECIEQGPGAVRPRTVRAWRCMQAAARACAAGGRAVQARAAACMLLTALPLPPCAPAPCPPQDGRIRVGKLNLVDLAGSERQSKTGATGQWAWSACATDRLRRSTV